MPVKRDIPLPASIIFNLFPLSEVTRAALGEQISLQIVLKPYNVRCTVLYVRQQGCLLNVILVKSHLAFLQSCPTSQKRR